MLRSLLLGSVVAALPILSAAAAPATPEEASRLQAVFERYVGRPGAGEAPRATVTPQGEDYAATVRSRRAIATGRLGRALRAPRSSEISALRADDVHRLGAVSRMRIAGATNAHARWLITVDELKVQKGQRTRQLVTYSVDLEHVGSRWLVSGFGAVRGGS